MNWEQIGNILSLPSFSSSSFHPPQKKQAYSNNKRLVNILYRLMFCKYMWHMIIIYDIYKKHYQ